MSEGGAQAKTTPLMKGVAKTRTPLCGWGKRYRDARLKLGFTNQGG